MIVRPPSKARRGLLNPALRKRSMRVVPNLFTTGALSAGFFAIVQAMDKDFVWAAGLIFVAMVLDGLDGRVARALHAQSEFGAQYDSLSDMVSFGVAPALVVYEWSLRGFGQVGWMAAFFYCAMAALRLARFNTNIEVVDKRFFQGLPSPAAAAIVAGFVWVANKNAGLFPVGGRDGPLIADWVALILTVYAGATMFVTVPFRSGKNINLHRSVSIEVGVTVIFCALLLYYAVLINPPIMLFLAFLAYGVSGYVAWSWKRLRRGREPKRQQDLF